MENQKTKISVFSKFICIALTIAFVVYIVMLVLQVSSWIIAAWELPESFQLGNTKITLPTVFVLEYTKVYLTKDVTEIAAELAPTFLWGSFIGIMQSVVTIVVLRFCKGLFVLLKDSGTPFRIEVVKSLRKTAIALLVLGVISEPAAWIAAGIAYVLSMVFEYGVSLQNESDTTL